MYKSIGQCRAENNIYSTTGVETVASSCGSAITWDTLAISAEF